MEARMRRNPSVTMKNFISGMFAPGERDDQPLACRIDRLLASIPRPDLQTALQGLHLLEETDLRGLLPSVALPVLIMGGDRDAICLPEASAYLARRIPESSQVVLSGCGHAPFLTRCTEFNDAITSFSRRIFEQSR